MSLHLTDLTVARNKNVICCTNLNLISLCNLFRLQYGFRKYLHAIFAAPNFPILSYHHYALRVLPSCENFSYIFPKREESRLCNLGNEYASYYLRSVLDNIGYKSTCIERNNLSEIYVMNRYLLLLDDVKEAFILILKTSLSWLICTKSVESTRNAFKRILSIRPPI